VSAPRRRRIGSGSAFEPAIGFSRAVRVGDRVLVSGTAPVWPDGSCDPDPCGRRAPRPRWRVEIEAEAVVGR
jgi:enamine deaminase RidA (YjgF/YER057c/UK114 family)